MSQQNVLFWCDNQTVVHALNSGRCIPRLQQYVEFILMAEREMESAYRFAYIPTDLNTQADIASRGGKVCSAPNYILDRHIVQQLV